MNRLHDVLTDIAGQAPIVDLADRAVRGNRRRRRTGMALAAVAVTAAVTVLGAAAGTGLLPGEGGEIAAKPSHGGVVADLPNRGVGPLGYAYKTFCSADGASKDCRNGGWRVVTRDGETYHVPQALGLSDKNYIPLTITRDGRMMAYYSRGEQTFKIRDLDSGKELTAPVTVAERQLGLYATLVLSDDGRRLAFTGYPNRKEPGLLIDMRAGTTTPVPSGWVPTSIANGGDPVTLISYWPKARVWLMSPSGGPPPVTLDKPYVRFSALSPDSRSLAALGAEKLKGGAMRMDNTISVLDAMTGRTGKKVTLRGLPKNMGSHRLGAWLNRTEVTLSAVMMERGGATRQITYAVNTGTGQARELRSYTGQNPSHLVVPGVDGR
ncbi:hypothetical protein AB0M44_28685 [Streptosporangium subroseum]|uniref:hypothetical protein n=1 Tax=Streptosporangium subroseum TaxID=106412 RepID=UPI003416E92D